MAIKRTKTVTYREVHSQLSEAKSKLAVWEYLYDHLTADFVSVDGRPPKRHLIPEGSAEQVSEQALESVLEAIGTGPIEQLKDTIVSLEMQAIPVQEGTKKAS